METAERSLLTLSQRHMATEFELSVVVDSRSLRQADSVLLECHALVRSIEDRLSRFREGSLVSQINRARAGEKISFVEESDFRTLVEISAICARRSENAFNPFFSREDFQWDWSHHQVSKTKDSAWIDFGAIGKGYALDQVAVILERNGFSDFCLSAGGSSWIFRGWDEERAPWKMIWAWERDAEQNWIGHRYELPAGRPLAVGVSGLMEKGQHFHNGVQKLESKVLSSIYVGRSAAEADALSTGLLVGAHLYGDEILTILDRDRTENPSFAYVDLEGQMFYNRNFETQFLKQGRLR